MRPDELERELRQRLDALGPMARHSLLTVLSPPDSERAAMIRQLGSNPQNGSPPNY